MGKRNSKTKIEYIVEYNDTFLLYYNQRFSKSTVAKIDDFIDHFVVNGLTGWKGKTRSTANVPEGYPDREARIAKAKEHNLWHVHIGEPEWIRSSYGNYWVSAWVLQFKKISKYHIVLVELSHHKPMLLPSDEMLK